MRRIVDHPRSLRGTDATNGYCFRRGDLKDGSPSMNIDFKPQAWLTERSHGALIPLVGGLQCIFGWAVEVVLNRHKALLARFSHS